MRPKRNLAASRLVACPNHLEPSLSGGDQPVRAGRPFERLRLLPVMQRNELLDRRLEILEGIEDAAPDVTTGLKLPKSAEAEFPSQGAANSFRGACPPERKQSKIPSDFSAEGGSRVIKLLYLNHDIGYPSPALAKAGDGAVHGAIKLVARPRSPASRHRLSSSPRTVDCGHQGPRTRRKSA